MVTKLSAKNRYGIPSADYERLYNVWKNMRARCCDETDKSYHNYGGRGIGVCAEWLSSFHAFVDWTVKSGWEPGLTLERNDVNGDYSPENCRWATKKEQARNVRKNIRITIEGETKCLMEWCEIFGFPYNRARLRYTRDGVRDVAEIFYEGDLRELRPRILQMTLDGEVIAEYVCARDAAKVLEVHESSVRRALNGRRKTAGGFRWKYKNESEED